MGLYFIKTSPSKKSLKNCQRFGSLLAKIGLALSGISGGNLQKVSGPVRSGDQFNSSAQVHFITSS